MKQMISVYFVVNQKNENRKLKMNKTYNKKTWHFRLATVYANMSENTRSISICEYIEHVVWGLIGVIFIIAAGSFMLSILIAPIWWLAFSLYYGFIYDFTTVPVAGLALWFILLMIVAIILYHDNENNILAKGIIKIKHKCVDNFIVHTIQSISQKVCFMIEFK